VGGASGIAGIGGGGGVGGTGPLPAPGNGNGAGSIPGLVGPPERGPCDLGFIFWEGRCIREVNNCVYYLNSVCSFCATGFRITLFGQCSFEGFNIRCEEGFYLERRSNRCLPIDSFCDTHNPETGRCITCILGYVFKGDFCVLETRCSGLQYEQDEICVNFPIGTIGYDPLTARATLCA